MITLRESLLSKSTDKINNSKKIIGNCWSELGFPDETQLHYATGRMYWYEWDYQPYIYDNEDIIKKFISKGNYFSLSWIPKEQEFLHSQHIKIVVKVKPAKNPDTNKNAHRIDIGLMQYGFKNLGFTYYVGGTKQASIKKAYTLLKAIRDNDEMFTDIINMTIKNVDHKEAAEHLIKKYKIDI